MFVYRLLTEGTVEEKVYSRSVNKTSLSLRVVDKKHPERNFNASELENLLEHDSWVQCDRCDKWRMLPPEADNIDNLPEKWFCELNELDPERSTCDAAERDDKFYSVFFAERNLLNAGEIKKLPGDSLLIVETAAIVQEAETLAYTKRDTILSHLLEATSRSLDTSACNGTDVKMKCAKQLDIKMEGDKGATKLSNVLVSKYYFHDSLLKDHTDTIESHNLEPPDDDDDLPSASGETPPELMNAKPQDGQITEEVHPDYISNQAAMKIGAKKIHPLSMTHAILIQKAQEASLKRLESRS